MTMNGLTLTARQPETTRRTGKKYGASTGVYDVQGSNLLAVVGKTRLGQPATEETKKAPAQARVSESHSFRKVIVTRVGEYGAARDSDPSSRPRCSVRHVGPAASHRGQS